MQEALVSFAIHSFAYLLPTLSLNQKKQSILLNHFKDSIVLNMESQSFIYARLWITLLHCSL
ncbi:hypothetical protein [Helicobacter rodentium]|uniref:hypothetical protein n=1 Tax=Helicobacter rodentium TaxID=59617 RepID=UPI002354ECA8|nr:hypothetical protein [Helicobacter rodentium]